MHSYPAKWSESKEEPHRVLILVLMEDALVLIEFILLSVAAIICLNPCFNGRCTRTNFEKAAIARFGMS